MGIDESAIRISSGCLAKKKRRHQRFHCTRPACCDAATLATLVVGPGTTHVILLRLRLDAFCLMAGERCLGFLLLCGTNRNALGKPRSPHQGVEAFLSEHEPYCGFLTEDALHTGHSCRRCNSLSWSAWMVRHCCIVLWSFIFHACTGLIGTVSLLSCSLSQRPLIP